MQQQANDLVGSEVVAAAIHPADPVRIAIRHQANVVRVLPKKRRTAPVVLLDRLRINAAEKHIVAAVQRRHFAGRARQQFLEATGPHAEQRLVRKSKP
jgi:hypothetical protein